MSNPFSPTSIVSNERGVFGSARLVRSWFLYRVIEIDSPLNIQLVYNGWWFRQKVEINGETSWFQISWLTIQRHVEFDIPSSVDPGQPSAAIEIEFGKALLIRRFRVWVSQQLVYDEIN